MKNEIEIDAQLKKWVFAGLLIVLVITFIPWLGMTPFNTKGEPREAIVAMSMMQSGNYILPVSMGVDIPYKPPFLAWLIVGASYITGGINEFASRLPSAVAGIAMIMSVGMFFTRRSGWTVGILTAIVTATNIEVWRAVSACRVDMVLTACMVGGLLVMESGYRRCGRIVLSPWTILLLTGAALTKGPVGVALPCLVMLVYVWLGGGRLWQSFWRLSVIGVLSLVALACWYVAAYNCGGGEAFVSLAVEENIGRLTGRMSYESHVNPFYYNFITLFSGMLPYTLLALFSLFTVRVGNVKGVNVKAWLGKIRSTDATVLFSATVVAVIFIFYCIPASKRSVYLLPIYPFVSYFVALLMVRMGRLHRWVVNSYGCVIAIVAILMSVVLFVVKDGYLDSDMFGRSVAPMVASLADKGGYFTVLLLILPIATTPEIFRSLRRSGWMTTLFATMVTTFTIYWCLAGYVLPGVLSVKSDRSLAQTVTEIVPDSEPIYQFINDPMLRYYTVGFYTGDRVRLYDGPDEGASASVEIPQQARPDSGWILISKKDMQVFEERHPDVNLELQYKSQHKSGDRRDTVMVFRFNSPIR